MWKFQFFMFFNDFFRISIHFTSLLFVLCVTVGLNGFDLQCTFNNNSWTQIGSTVDCTVSNLQITTRNQIVSSVNGQDSKTFSDSNIRAIRVIGQTVHYLPEGLGYFFPNLEAIQISSLSMKEVNREDLAQFPQLKVLALSNSDLVSLPSNLFEGNPHLLSIGFRSNKLTHVGRGILTPLKKLQEAYFGKNVCIDHHVDKQSNIESLVAALDTNCRNDTIDDELDKKKIDMKLRSLEDSNTSTEGELKAQNAIIDAFSHLLFLLSPSLDEKFSQVFPESIDIKCKFISTAEICEVIGFISENPILSIAKIVDEKNSELNSSITKLSIVNQKTLFLPVNIGEKLPKITEISIVNSGLFQFRQQTFAGLTLLTSLLIVRNKVHEIPKNSFTDNVNLQYLNFSINLIEVIDKEAFANLENLKSLDLSQNHLISLDSEVFSSLSSLEILKLNDNKFQILSPNLLKGIPKLAHVDISSE